MRPHRWWRAAARLLLAAGAAVALAAPAAAHEATPHRAREGRADFLAHGETALALHGLRGEWGFTWGRFLDPSRQDPPTAFTEVPGSWNSVTEGGKPPGADGFGTYTLRVDCAPGQQLALAVPPQRTAMHLYVNGQLAAVQGDPGVVAEMARPAIGRRATLTESFPCPLWITAHVSNFSHRSGGMVRAPTAGPLEVLAPEFQRRLALDTLLLGAYLVLSVLPLIFYLARRKDDTPLLVGLFCLAQAVYADMTGERLLLLMAGGDTPWEPYLKTEYLAWYTSMGLFLLLVHRLFRGAMRPRAVRWLAFGALAGAALVAATPARVFSEAVIYGQLLGLAIGGHVIVAMVQAARRGRHDALVLLAGTAFLALALAANVVQAWTGEPLNGLITLALLLFVLSPTVVLARRLARALTTEELRSTEQREKADMLVRSTKAGILEWDAVRGETHYSPRLLEILGFASDVDTSEWPLFFERLHPDDRPSVREHFVHQLRQRVVRNGEMRHEGLDYRVLRGDGDYVWVHADAISVRGPDGRTLRFICSILDITEHRAVAERLRRQNAALAENARLREDVERMSRHDLKTPLNSIIGVARLLMDDPQVQVEHRELLAITERAGYRILEMVNLSLDLSRMEMGTYDFRPQAVNLVDVTARVAQDLASHADAARVQVRHDHAFTGPVYARAEELLCYSILANLLKNAIEATPPGGTVRIGIEPGEPVRLWVRNPTQVPEDFRKRFFDKYATLGKSGGTGLGTYSARLMARVQGGELEMASGVDGTLLTLTLRPLGAEQLPAPKLPTPQGLPAPVLAADFGPRRVLVVDDDEYNRLLLLRYLPSPPFTVETAANGQAATEAMARHWPDIVLIDMEMPVMNGLEAVGWLRAREEQDGREPCLVVMLSSNDDPVSIRRGLAAGSNRYLTKPFTREALLAVMHELDTGGRGLPTQVPLELEAPVPAPAEVPAPVDPRAAVHVDGELRPEVPAFLESRRRMVDGMLEALASGNREQLRAVAHRAAGGLALFGFQWAAWQSRRISQQAAEGDSGWLGDEIGRLRDHLQEVRVQ